MQEHVDVCRFMGKRGRRRSVDTPAPKRVRKSDPKRPAKRRAKRPDQKRINPALAQLDHFSSDSSQPGTSLPFEPATSGKTSSEPVPVIVNGEEEWVVERLIGEMEVETDNELGEMDIVKKYEVHMGDAQCSEGLPGPG